MKSKDEILDELFNNGRDAFRAGNYNQAKRYFEEALSIERELGTLGFLGLTLSRLMQKEEAIKLYDEALEIEPTHPITLQNKADVLYDLKRYDESLKCLELRAEYHEKDAIYFCIKAKNLERQQKYDEALKCCDEGLIIDPNDASLYANKASISKLQGKYNDALLYYNKDLELNPNCAITYVNRADCYLKLKQNKLAISDLQKASELMNQGHIKNTDMGNIQYIKNNIAQITSLQAQEDKAASIIEANGDNPLFTDVKKQFTKLKEQNEKVTSQVLTNMSLEAKQGSSALSKISQDNITLTREAFNDLLSQIAKIQAQMVQNTNQLSYQQQQISNNTNQLSYQNQALSEAGTYKQAELNREISIIKDSTPLLSYYKAFYFGLSNYIYSYKIASTGMFEVNYDFDKSNAQVAKSSISEFSIKTAASALTDVTLEVTKAIPLAGSIISLIDSLVDSVLSYVKDYKFTNKVNAINNIIKSKFATNNELEEAVTKLAISSTNMKKEILKKSTKTISDGKKNAISKLQEAVSSKIQNIEKKLIEEKVVAYEDLKENQTSSKAILDIALVLSYMYRNSDKICKEQLPFEEILLEAIRRDLVLENIIPSSMDLSGQGSKQSNEKTPSCNCQIFKVETKYHDPLAELFTLTGVNLMEVELSYE